jgi:hypothetical protein
MSWVLHFFSLFLFGVIVHLVIIEFLFINSFKQLVLLIICHHSNQNPHEGLDALSSGLAHDG